MEQAFNANELRDELEKKLNAESISIPVMVTYHKGSCMELPDGDGIIEYAYNPSEENLLEAADNVIVKLLQEKKYKVGLKTEDRINHSEHKRTICFYLKK